MRNTLLILSCVFLTFAASSVDNAVSPIVALLHSFYSIPTSSVLLLITSCSLGIVVGNIVGPVLVAKYDISHLFLYTVIPLSIFLCLFTLMKSFNMAIISRGLFGLCFGIIASIIWWLTFEGTSGKTANAMITLNMTVRSAAICIGVPVAGFITFFASWKMAFLLFLLMILLAIYPLYKRLDQIKHLQKKKKVTLLKEYKNVFSLPHSISFYLGTTLNSIAYFGFYAFAGIWFMTHYQLNLQQISTIFIFMGAAELMVNLFTIEIYKKFPYKKLFPVVSVLNILAFAFFIVGILPLYITLPLIIAFIMLNRIFLFAVLKSIGVIFAQYDNKATLGSLITVTSWGGFAMASWYQAKFLTFFGIKIIDISLIACLLFGIIIMNRIHRKNRVNFVF